MKLKEDPISCIRSLTSFTTATGEGIAKECYEKKKQKKGRKEGGRGRKAALGICLNC